MDFTLQLITVNFLQYFLVDVSIKIDFLQTFVIYLFIYLGDLGQQNLQLTAIFCFSQF